MKRTIGLMLAIVFAMAVWMPLSTSAQDYGYRGQTHEQRERQRRRWRARMNRNGYYSNEGRRYRYERQYYYNNGRRYTRMVRIYF